MTPAPSEKRKVARSALLCSQGAAARRGGTDEKSVLVEIFFFEGLVFGGAHYVEEGFEDL